MLLACWLLAASTTAAAAATPGLAIQFPSLGMLDLYETFHESGVFIFRLT
jgi:hypothetical protein